MYFQVIDHDFNRGGEAHSGKHGNRLNDFIIQSCIQTPMNKFMG